MQSRATLKPGDARIGDVGEQHVQRVAELVEEDARVERGHERRLAGGGARRVGGHQRPPVACRAGAPGPRKSPSRRRWTCPRARRGRGTAPAVGAVPSATVQTRASGWRPAGRRGAEAQAVEALGDREDAVVDDAVEREELRARERRRRRGGRGARAPRRTASPTARAGRGGRRRAARRCGARSPACRGDRGGAERSASSASTAATTAVVCVASANSAWEAKPSSPARSARSAAISRTMARLSCGTAPAAARDRGAIQTLAQGAVMEVLEGGLRRREREAQQEPVAVGRAPRRRAAPGGRRARPRRRPAPQRRRLGLEVGPEGRRQHRQPRVDRAQARLPGLAERSRPRGRRRGGSGRGRRPARRRGRARRGGPRGRRSARTGAGRAPTASSCAASRGSHSAWSARTAGVERVAAASSSRRRARYRRPPERSSAAIVSSKSAATGRPRSRRPPRGARRSPPRALARGPRRTRGDHGGPSPEA